MWIGCIASVMAWWSSLNVENQSALIQAGGTMLAATLAIGGLIIQLRSQAKQSRITLLETEARKLKMLMYEEGVAVSRDVSDKAIVFSSTVFLLSQELNSEILGIRGAYPAPQAKIEFRQIMHEHIDYSDSCIRFAYLIENRRIIDPQITIFRDVLSAFCHNTRTLFDESFIPHVMRVLPATLADGRFVREEVTHDRLDLAKTILLKMHDQLGDVVALMEDFNVEIQNLLLGDIFDRKVEYRKPINPTSMVVTLDRYDEISAALADTPWGRTRQAAELEAQRQFRPMEEDRGLLRRLMWWR